MALNLLPLIDGSMCFQTVRELLRPEGVVCPRCDLRRVMRGGCDDTQVGRQRYVCGGGEREFDDLTETNFTGHH